MESSGSIEFTPINNITIRIGSGWHKLNNMEQLIENIINNFSCGLGVEFKTMDLDVGFMNLDAAGYVLGISIDKNLN